MEIKPELDFAQLLIRRTENGFELRHADDRETALENLRRIQEDEVRELSQFTSGGAFRPLKSAPNLQTGWWFLATNLAQLEFALNTLYPGAVADWFAVRSGSFAPTHFRPFTARQTGMYRITAMLSDAQAAPVIRACCAPKFCLKQRLWTVEGLTTDSIENKSLIPCLEPCALLMEFARKAMRLQQAEERGETESNVESAEEHESIREADFENPNNPRRLQLVKEKVKNSER